MKAKSYQEYARLLAEGKDPEAEENTETNNDPDNVEESTDTVKQKVMRDAKVEELTTVMTQTPDSVAANVVVSDTNLTLLTSKLSNFLKYVKELQAKYNDEHLKSLVELLEGKPVGFALSYITTEMFPYKERMSEYVKKEFVERGVDISKFEIAELTKFKRYCQCFVEITEAIVR